MFSWIALMASLVFFPVVATIQVSANSVLLSVSSAGPTVPTYACKRGLEVVRGEDNEKGERKRRKERSDDAPC